MIAFIKQAWAGLRVLLVFTVVLGVGYPAVVLAVGQLTMRDQANGSLVADGADVASALIAQELPGDQWFQPRPSAVDPADAAAASGASNLGPNSATLTELVGQRRAEVAQRELVDPADVPPDAVTASGSGLDPHISPAYAELQIPRVARENGLPQDEVRRIVADATSGPDLGFLGEERVNVTLANIALARAVAGVSMSG